MVLGTRQRVLVLAVLGVAAPGAVLAWRWFHSGLGANPVEALHHGLGQWTLRFLLGALAVSPIVRWAGVGWLMPARRVVGLAAFGYGVAHLVVWASLDYDWQWREILVEVLQRPFIAWGLAALLLMTPLALTSTRGAVRRLGGSRWRALHQLIYPAAAAGVFHFMLKALPKEGPVPPAPYFAALLFLLSFRAFRRRPPARLRPPERQR